jgi:hypothetical protein
LPALQGEALSTMARMGSRRWFTRIRGGAR